MTTKLLTASLVILGASEFALAQSRMQQWQFDARHVKGATAKPLSGTLAATIVGPVKFAKARPHALILEGDAKKRHGITLTDDIKKAALPGKTISVEAWVMIDRSQPWGGIIGAVQDNGNYERGWVLGFRNRQFFFALASRTSKRLTYLMARRSFQTGFWYHVVGTYDGNELRIYVDGRLRAKSTSQRGPIEYPPRAYYTIGAYRDDDNFYPMSGQLEQVGVSDRVFSETVVAKRFRSRKDRFPEIDAVIPQASDWPMYLRDSQRTGTTTSRVEFPLRLHWKLKSARPPQPSWPEPAKHDFWHKKYNLDPRVTFDRAFQVVSVGNRLYFGSSVDDQVRCLEAGTGRQLWSFFAEGPVRCAPSVFRGRLYFGSDDGHVYCLDARDGTLLWKRRIGPSGRQIAGNGRIISAWPVRTDVLIDEGRAYVCAGIFPSQGVYQASLDLRDGRTITNQKLGVTAQGYLSRSGGRLYVPTGRNPAGAFVAALKRRGKELGPESANLPAEYPYAFVRARNVRIAGGNGKVAAFAVNDAKKIWSAAIDGKAYGLAISRGRLFVSTDTGCLYCFAPGRGDSRIRKTVDSPEVDTKHIAAVDRILRRSGVSMGYCLLLGSGNGRLAIRLARRSRLKIVVREPDRTRVETSRALISSVGLAGRIAVQHGSLKVLPYSDYLFNLIVNESLSRKPTGWNRNEVLRVLRPEGGVTIIDWTKAGVVRRGPLAGAGEWSHQYADAGNTVCSNDTRVSGELALQWFGRPGPRPMIDRHHRTAAPLYKDGRMFIPAEDRVIAVDAYNGVILWDRKIPKSRRVSIPRDCSYLAAGRQHLYVAAADKCLALHPQTGRTVRTFSIPGSSGTKADAEWGYVASVGDVLLGSAAMPGSSRRTQSRTAVQQTYGDFVPVVCSESLFALDPRDGTPSWTYRPESGLILNPSIAVGKGSVFFVESTNPQLVKKRMGRARLSDLLAQGCNIVALDLKTGKPRWKKSGPFTLFRHNLYLAHTANRLIVTGSRNSGKDKRKATVLVDVHVFDAANGKRIWFKSQNQFTKAGGDHGEQDQRPVIVGSKLYCEPYAYHLETGKPLDWKWPWRQGKRRGGCGNIAACANSFFFRDRSLSMFELSSNRAKKVTAETRPGCWINVIPAGGLLLAPEASSGCSCNFSVQTSLALIPLKRASSGR